MTSYGNGAGVGWVHKNRSQLDGERGVSKTTKKCRTLFMNDPILALGKH